jgi:hypothetical protein
MVKWRNGENRFAILHLRCSGFSDLMQIIAFSDVVLTLQ